MVGAMIAAPAAAAEAFKNCRRGTSGLFFDMPELLLVVIGELSGLILHRAKSDMNERGPRLYNRIA